jgi:hypothetical protein
VSPTWEFLASVTGSSSTGSSSSNRAGVTGVRGEVVALVKGTPIVQADLDGPLRFLARLFGDYDAEARSVAILRTMA